MAFGGVARGNAPIRNAARMPNSTPDVILMPNCCMAANLREVSMPHFGIGTPPLSRQRARDAVNKFLKRPRLQAARHSARMRGLLRRAWALPPLRTLLLHRGLATVDEQAIALALTLAAYSAVSQPRTTASLAGRGQFFIHLVSLHLSGRQRTPACHCSCTKQVAKRFV